MNGMKKEDLFEDSDDEEEDEAGEDLFGLTYNFIIKPDR